MARLGLNTSDALDNQASAWRCTRAGVIAPDAAEHPAKSRRLKCRWQLPKFHRLCDLARLSDLPSQLQATITNHCKPWCARRQPSPSRNRPTPPLRHRRFFYFSFLFFRRRYPALFSVRAFCLKALHFVTVIAAGISRHQDV